MAKTLMANMSVSEKADQMRGTVQPPLPPPSTYWDDIFRQVDNTIHMIRGLRFRDGPRGVNLDAKINGGGSQGKSTVFPVPMARGATFDMDLEYQIGRALGDEMVASQQTMLLAPTANILRHPLWGRAQETYGEDVFLLGRMGTAVTAGIQEYIPACAKHFAANNIENSRHLKNAVMDEQTLREIYARHFEMMIKDGGVACIMAAYNPVNGLASSKNKHLITDILRSDFGFTGFVMTDWWALTDNNSIATGDPTTAAAGVNAGLDMELPMGIDYKSLESIVGSTVMQTQIDAAAARVLEQKVRFNVTSIAGPVGLKGASTQFVQGSIANNQANVDLALRAAVESMVLLKNDISTLPIKRTPGLRIAVVGTKEDYFQPSMTAPGINNRADDFNNGTIDFPNGVRLGDVGSSRADPTTTVSPCAGIQMAAGTGVTVTCGNALPAASAADFVVVVAGLTPYDEGEEYNGSGDRSSFALNGKLNSGSQNALITQAAALGKPMVVVLEGGSVIDMPWLSSVPAVVMAWYPGMVGGKALGQLLFGDSNFSGKLPISWPASLADLPTFNGGANTAMDYYLGYRYFDNNPTKKPLFPFGFGKSYTTFKYENLQVPCSDAKAPTATTTGSVVNVSVDVTNTGAVKGDETVLLFVSYPSTTARRSKKELKGFSRITLNAGSKQTVTIPVRVSDLKYFDMTSSSWKVESGPVQVMVGPSSDNLPLNDTFTVK